MEKYDPSKIEPKWQKIWDEKKVFAAEDPSASSGQVNSTKPKWYSLIEFPYPSGAGMHVGHIRSNTAMDIVSRKRRMEGYNVLYPMGWDAFGLPTENYAIKTGISPQEATKTNTDTFRRQLKSMGFSFDWSREVNTTDPKYYKWTQWIFQQFFKKGLAYKAAAVINWCPKDKTGLANEEVLGGKCERCGTAVEQKAKEQWMLKITAYAEKLLDGLKEVDYLPEIKAQQENWIGRSEGAEISFGLTTHNSQLTTGSISVFTTRPETLFGATYLVLAPEHEVVSSLKSEILNWDEVEHYVAATKLKNDLDRTEAKEKTGVELNGVKAVNPATKEEIPVWIGDYVLATYGTGAIMAVPAHDERDFVFAKKYQLPVTPVVEPLALQTTGDDAVRADMPYSERNVAMAIVKHWQEEKYLCLRWKLNGWQGFVTGGIEDGEDAGAAAIRELEEETGYSDAKFIRQTEGLVHGKFYHGLKKVNRFAHFRGVYIELQSDTKKEISADEAAIHDVLWLSRQEVEKFMNRDDVRWVWQALMNPLSAHTGQGVMVNSDEFSGMDSEKAKKAITEFVGGKTTVKYKLRDWVFSRQRYWGEPIPLVNCSKCGWVCIPEKELPLELPEIEKYQPTDTGESPLAMLADWVNTKCPECSGPAKRETDTMPNWAGSSWYSLRYCDPMNDAVFADKKKLDQFMPVDWYNGGMEHVTLHLLYSRFWNLFLYDQGLVPTKEPYKKRTAHGMILASDGRKMSKSWGNVVNPEDLIKEFGADALRLYEMFIGPFNQAVAWDQRGILGTARFLERVWKIGSAIAETDNQQLTTSNAIKRLLHKTIKKVGEDIESMNFNTAVSAMMIFVNELSSDNSQLTKEEWGAFLRILSPFAPHITEELNVQLTTHNKKLITKTTESGYQLPVISDQLLCQQPWPVFDASLLVEDTFEMMIQVNGKIRGRVTAQRGILQADAEKIALEMDEIKKWVVGSPKKVVFVENRLINFII